MVSTPCEAWLFHNNEHTRGPDSCYGFLPQTRMFCVYVCVCDVLHARTHARTHACTHSITPSHIDTQSHKHTHTCVCATFCVCVWWPCAPMCDIVYNAIFVLYSVCVWLCVCVCVCVCVHLFAQGLYLCIYVRLYLHPLWVLRILFNYGRKLFRSKAMHLHPCLDL